MAAAGLAASKRICKDPIDCPLKGDARLFQGRGKPGVGGQTRVGIDLKDPRMPLSVNPKVDPAIAM